MSAFLLTSLSLRSLPLSPHFTPLLINSIRRLRHSFFDPPPSPPTAPHRSVEEGPTREGPLTSLQCGRLLQSLTDSKSLELGCQLHAHALSSGALTRNTYLATKLCAFYAACRRMTEARLLFDGIDPKNAFLWNVMVRGYACSGFPEESLTLYRNLLSSGGKADNFTYPFVLMACGNLLLVELGEKIHSEVIVCGYASDVYVGNSLLSMHCKFGEMEVAQKVFDRLSVKDSTTWNTMISGYARNGNPTKALSLFTEVVMLDREKLDQVSLVSILPACADLMTLEKAKEIHAFVVRSHVGLDGPLNNALISVYANTAFMIGARRLFENMSKKDTVSWNSMISGFARGGDAMESLNLFCQMNSKGVVPDTITFISLLEACNQIAALQFGRSIHAFLVKKGLDNGVTVGTALIHMYSKCGSLTCSCKIFNHMLVKNLISWSAMISAYGLHGRGKEAVACFNEMNVKGIRPDKVALTSLLSACSHSGLLDEGKEIFHQMPIKYCIKPSSDHYSCMVDLLGRAGHLDEAYQLINSLDVKPNIDVWVALLSASYIWNNIDLAEIASHNIFILKPMDIGPYVSLSNMYAKQKRWTDVERVRAVARLNRFQKTPGSSFVELDKRVHRFLVGDKSHPQSEAIYAKLDELRMLLKEAGYVPDTSSVFYDVEEEVKEKMLWDHSERLAIAFALLNTFPGKTIRITKNLRTCKDCHMATKLISKLVNRKIIVRDAHRFHHFEGGSCSCGDYW